MSHAPTVVFSTDIAAVSGNAFIVIDLKLQKSMSMVAQYQPHIPTSSPPHPCISSGAEIGEKKKKKVRFAKDVVELLGDNEEFRKRLSIQIQKNNAADVKVVRRRMSANRAALYNGILRDRVVHRIGYSY